MAQDQHTLTRRDALRLAGGAASLAALGSVLPGVAQAAAPMLGPVRPTIYRFKLGAFEVTNILDGYRGGPGPHPTFGNNQTAETVQDYARANPEFKGFADLAPYGWRWPSLPSYAKINAATDNGVIAIVRQDVGVKAGLAQMQKEAQTLLDEDVKLMK